MPRRISRRRVQSEPQIVRIVEFQLDRLQDRKPPFAEIQGHLRGLQREDGRLEDRRLQEHGQQQQTQEQQTQLPQTQIFRKIILLADAQHLKIIRRVALLVQRTDQHPRDLKVPVPQIPPLKLIPRRE